jgi:hypothetical protein
MRLYIAVGGDWNAFGPQPVTTPAIRSTGGRPNDYRRIQDRARRLIKKGSIAGLSSNAMADELTDAAERLTSNGEHDDSPVNSEGLRTTLLACDCMA